MFNQPKGCRDHHKMDKDEHYTAAESCGVVSPKATRTKAKQEKTDTNLTHLDL